MEPKSKSTKRSTASSTWERFARQTEVAAVWGSGLSSLGFLVIGIWILVMGGAHFLDSFGFAAFFALMAYFTNATRRARRNP